VPTRTAVPARADSEWAQRLSEPGWLLLPLRAFLGITFCYAGLQKLANPDYLDANKPTSVAGQMRLLQHSSPIGGLLGASMHAPVLVGLLIALGELAVGVGTLVGLLSRLAAVGGAALSLTFFLTVSWNTTPYYYGSDIVFAFAWLTMFLVGNGDVLSLQAWAHARAAEGVRLSRGRLRSRPRAEVDRRTVLYTGACAAAVAAATGVTAGLTAAVGRALHGSAHRGAQSGLGAVGAQASTPAATEPPSGSGTASASGTAIGVATAVPLGQARSFSDPATGNPAWVVHPSASTFVAFSAVCTHAGCPVQYDAGSVQFVCPCHGGAYDARTGQVLAGPPPSPLPRIPIRVVDGQLRVDA
jgi:thiosulfate dehydrogenase [quinone] large subunit